MISTKLRNHETCLWHTGRCCHSELSASFQPSHGNLFQGLSCNRGGDHRALCEPRLHWALVKEPGRAAAAGTACQVLVEQCGAQDAASRDLSKETFPCRTYSELMTRWNISAPVTSWRYPLFLSTCTHTVLYKALTHPQSASQCSCTKECDIYVLPDMAKKRYLVVSTVPVHKTVIIRDEKQN